MELEKEISLADLNNQRILAGRFKTFITTGMRNVKEDVVHNTQGSFWASGERAAPFCSIDKQALDDDIDWLLEWATEPDASDESKANE